MKKILSLVLVFAMLVSMVISVSAFDQSNANNGCKTNITAKRVNPDAVHHDGVIGKYEYEELTIDRGAKTNDLSIIVGGGSNSQSNAQTALQDIHFYFSWDEVNGLNFAVKYKQPTPLQMDYTMADYEAHNYGKHDDNFCAQQGLVWQIYRNSKASDGVTNFDVSDEYKTGMYPGAKKAVTTFSKFPADYPYGVDYYVGLSKATQVDGSEEKSNDGNIYIGQYDEGGYKLVPKEDAESYCNMDRHNGGSARIIEADYDGTNALVITDYDHRNILPTDAYSVDYDFDTNTVVYEVSVPFSYILRPDEINADGTPKTGVDLVSSISVCAGGSNPGFDDNNTFYFLCLGDIGAYAMNLTSLGNMWKNWRDGKKSYGPKDPTITFSKDKIECRHANKQNVSGVASTCIKAGTSAGVKCKDCGAVISGCEELPLAEHNLKHYDAQAASCTEKGWDAYDECQTPGCGYTTYKEIDPLDHHLVPVEEKEASCTEAGWDAYEKCDRDGCDYTTEIVTRPIIAHDYSVVSQKVDETCEDDGYTLYKCANCGAEENIKKDIVPALTHDYSVVSIQVPATCEEEGYTLYKCANCGAEENVKRDVENKLGHDLAHFEGQEPTEEEDGWEAYDVCKREGCDYSTYKKIPKLSHVHNIVNHEAKAATCTEVGWNAYETCSECDYSTYKENELPALNHDEIPHEAKAATCTEVGWNAYVTCSRCEYTTYNENELPALNHNYTEVSSIVEATCTDDGYTLYKCSRCGEEENVKKDIVPALNHNYSEVSSKVDVTCTADGYTMYKCSRCGEEENVKKDIVTAPGHDNTVVVSKVEATCEDDGYTLYKCSVCGTEENVRRDIVNALGHDFSAEFTTDLEPTEFNVGAKSRHCSRCDEKTDITILDKIVPQEVSNPFGDVKSKDWFYADTMTALRWGLMKGITDTEFQPKGNMTRAQVVTILSRLAQRNEKLTEEELAKYDKESQFKDVKKGQWYTKEVNWAAETGLVNGYEDGTFKPNKSVTRQELAKLIMGLVDYLGIEIPDSADAPRKFNDAKSIQAWAKPYVDAMRKSGLIKGDDAGNFNPAKTATRAEVTAIAVRLYPYTNPNIDIQLVMELFEDGVCVTHSNYPVCLCNGGELTAEIFAGYILNWMGLGDKADRYEVILDPDEVEEYNECEGGYHGQGAGSSAPFELNVILRDKMTGETAASSDVIQFYANKFPNAAGDMSICPEDFEEADFLHNLDKYLKKNDKGQYIVELGEYNADTVWSDISAYVMKAFGLSPRIFELALIDENELATKMCAKQLFFDAQSKSEEAEKAGDDEAEKHAFDDVEAARKAYDEMIKEYGKTISAAGGTIKVKAGILDNPQLRFSEMSYQKNPMKGSPVDIEFAVSFGN